MKVLYDHQIFEHQRIGGISRYFSEIIRNLTNDVEADVSIQYSFNEYLKNLPIPFQWKDQLLSYADFLPGHNFKGKKRLFDFLQKKYPKQYPNLPDLNKESTIKKLMTGDFDIFHPTFFSDYFLEYIGNKPYVLTVHDMIIELYPEFINSPLFVKRKKRLVENAAHIIAVSENTKNDIINVFGTTSEKISVVYHASSLQETDEKPQNLPLKYILYIGDRRLGYKNFAFFINTVQSILLNHKDLYIVCTGDEFTTDEIEFFKILGISNQIKRFFVSDNELFGLYQNAEMFIYPSYYEGFGIPILEAFQAECPVILANSSCFPEVAGDAGIYFDPKSPQSLIKSIQDVLYGEKKRKIAIEKGKERLKLFSWENSARQTVEIYNKVLSSSL